MNVEPLFIGLLILCSICHLNRTVYCVLKERKMISSENRSIYLFMWINMVLLWLSWFAMCAIDPFEFNIPNWLGYLGLFIFVFGIVLVLIPFFQLGGVENIDRFHTSGIYKMMRHPMYLGFIFWNLGLPLFTKAKFSLIVSIVWIVNILLWRYLEEKELIQKYDAYLEYKKQTIF